MNRLFIPSIGFEFVLGADWTFKLFDEYRNSDFAKKIGVTMPRDKNGYRPMPTGHVVVKLPAGCRMKVDRIYIRKGYSNFDSITFRVWLPGHKTSSRFFVKLADANNIVFED